MVKEKGKRKEWEVKWHKKEDDIHANGENNDKNIVAWEGGNKDMTKKRCIGLGQVMFY